MAQPQDALQRDFRWLPVPGRVWYADLALYDNDTFTVAQCQSSSPLYLQLAAHLSNTFVKRQYHDDQHSIVAQSSSSLDCITTRTVRSHAFATMFCSSSRAMMFGAISRRGSRCVTSNHALKLGLITRSQHSNANIAKGARPSASSYASMWRSSTAISRLLVLAHQLTK